MQGVVFWCCLHLGAWTSWVHYLCTPLDLSRWICSCDLLWFWSPNRMRQVQGPSCDTNCLVDVQCLQFRTGLHPKVVGHQHIKWGLFLCSSPVIDVVCIHLHQSVSFQNPISFWLCLQRSYSILGLLASICRERAHELANFIIIPLCYKAFQLFHVYFRFKHSV